MSPQFPFSFLLLLLLPLNDFSSISSATSTKFHILPRLSPTDPTILEHETQLLSESTDLETYFYSQTLDHFNFQPQSFDTFQQRYVIDSKFWGGPNSDKNYPIFVYFGAEGPLDSDLTTIGFLADNAAQFNALIVYIEHRYYGESVPFGSSEEALNNSTIRGYFNSVQAIADYAEIILHVKEKFNALYSPVIVLGGSYGGMLASWFRLKYPHIALGALASSAPILYFDDITPNDAYYSIVTKDYREVSETCYQTILKSWAQIDDVASQPNGLQFLSNKFKTCNPLKNANDLKDYLDSMYSYVAQYDRPPTYPVNMICNGIDGTSGDDIISKIFGGLVAYKGNISCYVNPSSNSGTTGWSWQTCSDMVIPLGRGTETMFPPYPFDLNSYVEYCRQSFGVAPRPHWVTTYYGGHSIKLILQRFGSNIIFSNGLRDPFSGGGVLQNISDTIVAVSTVHGSHCLDIAKANEATDPEWLVAQRKTEINIIDGWINQYYDDLLHINVTSANHITRPN